MVLGQCYTDRVVESRRLNGLLVSANNFYAFLFRNVINAPLMSKKTMKIKQELAGGEGNQSEKTQGAISGIPQKNKILFNVLFLLQVFLVLRFMAVCVYLSSYYPNRRPLVSHATPVGSMFHDSAKISLPVRAMPPTPPGNGSSYTESYTQSYTGTKTIEERECRANLNALFTRHYGRFYVWNASIEISTNDYARYLIIEQHSALQMCSKEVSIYNYLMGCMVATCGIFGCWLAARRPVDITPLVFVHEPRFVGAYTQRRLQNYLGLVHKSYKTFWSAFAFDWKNELIYHAQSCWSCNTHSHEEPQAGFQAEGADLEIGRRRMSFEIRLGEREFRSYTPTARSQAWRRCLLILHPVAQCQQTFTLFAGIFSLWMLFVFETDAERNASLSAFLAGATLPTLRATCGPAADSEATVRQSIMSNYARGLREDRFTRDRLAPTDFPTLGYWLVPTIILAISCQIISLYLCTLIMTVTDLCFWLVELRLKLHVCVSLLRHRRDERDTLEANTRCPLEDQMSIFGGDYRLPPLARIASRRSFSTRLGPARELHCARDDDEQVHHEPRKSLCNIELSHLSRFLVANRAEKNIICNHYARHILTADSTSSSGQQGADKFLLSTYLDLRLFLDQIDDCRLSMNIMIGFCVFHALNVIGGSTYVNDTQSKVGFIFGGFLLGNLGLIAAAFFQLQCSKLYRPIHSMLALSVRGDRTIRHLALLWRRSLVDFTGPKSKFSFTIYSIKITYASVLQFNLSVISLYILVLDKNRIEQH